MIDHKPFLRSVLDHLGPLPHLVFPEHPFAKVPYALQDQIERYPMQSDTRFELRPCYHPEDTRSVRIKREAARLDLMTALQQRVSAYANVLRHMLAMCRNDAFPIASFQSSLLIVGVTQVRRLVGEERNNLDDHLHAQDKAREVIKQSRQTAFDASTLVHRMLLDKTTVAQIDRRTDTSTLHNAVFLETYERGVVEAAKYACLLAEGDYIIDCTYTNTLRAM